MSDQEKIPTTMHLDDKEEHLAHLTSQEDHQISKFMAIKQNPWVFAWCIFAVWCIVVFSFDNQVGAVVLGIPQFRKDFGSPFQGNYVLPAKWQSAFSGGPAAG